jgi:hypothetical protein
LKDLHHPQAGPISPNLDLHFSAEDVKAFAIHAILEKGAFAE